MLYSIYSFFIYLFYNYIYIYYKGTSCGSGGRPPPGPQLAPSLFGVKGIATFSRIKSPLCQSQVFTFEDSLWMGIEVLHSLHIFFDGFSRNYKFVQLLLWLVLFISFFILVLLCCSSLICICPVYTFLVFNKLQLLIKKEKKKISVVQSNNLHQEGPTLD